MEYEGYDAMAREVLATIAQEAGALATSDRVAVTHRLGALDIGEISVAIAVSSPHRAEAFAAARFVIEEIKKRLPVWKREHYVDGDANWLKGHEPKPQQEGSG